MSAEKRQDDIYVQPQMETHYAYVLGDSCLNIEY